MPVENDNAVTDKCIKAMEEIGLKYVEMPEENMGSDDFSFMTVGVPACYVQIGAQSTLEGTSSNHHNTKFFLDEKGFLPVVEFFTQYVVDNYTE